MPQLSIQQPPPRRITSPAAPSPVDSHDHDNAHAGGLRRPTPSRLTLSLHELANLTDQLALLLETGVPAVESLQALAELSTRPASVQLLQQLAADVAGGTCLAEALEAHPRAFDRFYVATIQAGEATGGLAEACRRLEQHLRRKETLLGNIRSALIYPAVLAMLTSAAVIFLLIAVLPKFTTLFQNRGVELPLPTQILLTLTTLIQYSWPLLLVAAVAAVPLFSLLRNSRQGDKLGDWLLLRAPLLGQFGRLIETSMVMRMLGTMLQTGINLVDALTVVSAGCRTSSFRRLINQIKQGIMRGESLTRMLDSSELLSPATKQMIATGEKTGALAVVMLKSADYLDIQAEKQLRMFTTMLEPAMIVIMGFMVGMIALAILLPVFKLSTTVGGGG